MHQCIYNNIDASGGSNTIVVILLIIHNNSTICGKYGVKMGIKIDKCPIFPKSMGILNWILVKSIILMDKTCYYHNLLLITELFSSFFSFFFFTIKQKPM